MQTLSLQELSDEGLDEALVGFIGRFDVVYALKKWLDMVAEARSLAKQEWATQYRLLASPAAKALRERPDEGMGE